MNNKEFLSLMKKVKIYDLTMPLSVHTPPWPTYMPLQVQYFKRLAGCFGGGAGANGMVIQTSNHVGTHMDGEIHFFGHGRTIGQVPLEEWVGEGVVVDISDLVSDYSLYTPEMLMSKAEKRTRQEAMQQFTAGHVWSRFLRPREIDVHDFCHELLILDWSTHRIKSLLYIFSCTTFRVF